MAFGAVKGTLSGTGAAIAANNDATGSVSVAVGDLLVCVFGERTTMSVTGVTDNLGHTYTAGTGIDGGNGTGKVFWKIATSSGTLTTMTGAAVGGSGDDYSIVGAVYEGPFAASPLDQNPAANSDTVTPYVCTSSGTLAQADELVLAWMCAGNGFTGAACSGLTVDKQDGTGTGSGSHAAALASVVVSATTAIVPSWTVGAGNGGHALGVITFKKLIGGGGVVTRSFGFIIG